MYLAADAARLGEADLEQRFRTRALGAGLAAGAIAVGGVAVLHSDAHPLYHQLLDGDGLPALIVSVLAGLGTLGLVWRRRFESARYTAALAVAAIIAGWALAQQPSLLPGLTVKQAAAPHDTLVAVIVAVVAGGAILFPSLGLLFKLTLSGRLDHEEHDGSPEPGVESSESSAVRIDEVRVARPARRRVPDLRGRLPDLRRTRLGSSDRRRLAARLHLDRVRGNHARGGG